MWRRVGVSLLARFASGLLEVQACIRGALLLDTPHRHHPALRFGLHIFYDDDMTLPTRNKLCVILSDLYYYYY
jgi:hypothetical protein